MGKGWDRDRFQRVRLKLLLMMLTDVQQSELRSAGEQPICKSWHVPIPGVNTNGQLYPKIVFSFSLTQTRLSVRA